MPVDPKLIKDFKYVVGQTVFYSLLLSGFILYFIYYKQIFGITELIIKISPILFLFGFAILATNRYKNKRSDEEVSGAENIVVYFNYKKSLKIDLVTVLVSFVSLLFPEFLGEGITLGSIVQTGIVFCGMYLVKRMILEVY